MNTIEVHGSHGDTRALVGASLADLQNEIKEQHLLIIADREVYPMVKEQLPAKVPVFLIPGGDASKSLRSATALYRWLLHNDADRGALLLGIGGGAVCDLTGFVAATYLRGVRLGLVPTTLLAQVDASVGGKNALNLDGFKNVIGTIKQPEFILCDHQLLNTLPPDEIRGGLAELVKHAIIADPERFDYMHQHAERLLACDHKVLDPLIAWSVELKKRFVELDEYDHAERRLLNFGHTWGHAIEGLTGIHHGLAVAIGMEFATRFALHRGVCDGKTAERISSILTRFNLPLQSDVLKWVVYDAVLRDKKRNDDSIHFIFPEAIGSMKVEQVSLQELRDYMSVI